MKQTLDALDGIVLIGPIKTLLRNFYSKKGITECPHKSCFTFARALVPIIAYKRRKSMNNIGDGKVWCQVLIVLRIDPTV